MGTKKAVGVVVVQVAIPFEVEFLEAEDDNIALKVEYNEPPKLKTPTVYFKEEENRPAISQTQACVIADNSIIDAFPLLVEEVKDHAEKVHELQSFPLSDKKDLQ